MKLLFLIAIPLYAQSTFFVSSFLPGDDWLPTKDDSLISWYENPYDNTLWSDSANSNDLTLYNTPTINEDSLNEQNTITFDGVDQAGQAIFTLETPFTIIIVFRSITWTNIDYMYDGGSVNKSHALQNQAVGGTMYYQGSWTGTGNSPNVGTNVGLTYYQNWFILTTTYIGAGSTVRLNEQAVGTSPTGTFTSGTGDALGFTVGSRGDLVANYSNIEVAAVIITHATIDLTLFRHRRYLNKIFQVY